MKTEWPVLGVGIQYNPEILSWFPFEQQDLDVLEILLDTIMGPLDSPHLLLPGKEATIARLQAGYHLLGHSNYGCEFGFEPLESTPAVQRHVPLAKYLKSPWVVDHCLYGDCAWAEQWSSLIQFSKDEARRLGERAAQLQELYGVPLAHENAAYYVESYGSDQSEAEFLCRLVEHSGTYLHIDLHNIYTNSINFPEYDAWRFLRTVPLDRVVEIHLAGGSWDGGVYHDWHDSSVPAPVWEMLDWLLQRANPGALILEFQGRAHHAHTRVLGDEGDFAMVERDISLAKAAWGRAHNTSHADAQGARVQSGRRLDGR